MTVPAEAGPLPDLESTDRTRLGRMRERGTPDRAVLDGILAAGFLCHLGVVVDGHPMVVPTVYGATEDTLYFHGSVASPSLLSSPTTEVCVTVSHLDGIVLARSVCSSNAAPASRQWSGRRRCTRQTTSCLLGLPAVPLLVG